VKEDTVKENALKEGNVPKAFDVSKEINITKVTNVPKVTNMPEDEGISSETYDNENIETYNNRNNVETYGNMTVFQQGFVMESSSDSDKKELKSDLGNKNSLGNSCIDSFYLGNNIEGTESENKLKFSSLHIIGQVFSTYIILEANNELYIIDQHAAHERILYERLKKKHKNKELTGQLLLSPVLIELTYQEQKLVMENIDFMKSLGFDFEPFGNNTVLLRSIPFSGETGNIKKVFLETVDMLDGLLKQGNTGMEDEILYSIACKSAVKANKKLDELEIKNLLKEIDLMGNIFTCPHGRPIVIKMAKNDIEKMFKR